LKIFDYRKNLTKEQLDRNEHRERVGGLWEEMGRLQLDYLVSQGLQPHHYFLDVACGSLRAGRFLVDYLEPGRYYGVDINESLIDVGYHKELSDEQREKLPMSNLRVTDRFDCDFGVPFDMAIAQSLFTHIPLNDIRLCLYRVAKSMQPGGRFFVTFFEARKAFPVDGIKDENARGRSKYTEQNPFWYYRGDLRWASSFAPWEFNYIGDWGHPRRQKMIELTRTPGDL